MRASRINTEPGKQIFLITILFVLLLLLFNLLIPPMPSSSMMRDAFWASKVTQPELKYDIVYIGDSRVYRGIDPEVVSGVSGFNMGFSSAGFSENYLKFAAGRLKTKGRRIIFIGLSPNSFMSSSFRNEHFQSVMKWTSSDKWIKTHCYPYLQGFERLSFADLYKYSKGEKYFENYHIRTGYAASDRLPYDPESALKAYQEQFETDTWSYSAEQALCNFVTDQLKKGVRVVAGRLPVSPSMFDLEEKYNGLQMKRVEDQLRALNVEIFAMDGHINWKSYDGSHLCSSSATLYSKGLAEFLK